MVFRMAESTRIDSETECVSIACLGVAVAIGIELEVVVVFVKLFNSSRSGAEK